MRRAMPITTIRPMFARTARGFPLLYTTIEHRSAQIASLVSLSKAAGRSQDLSVTPGLVPGHHLKLKRYRTGPSTSVDRLFSTTTPTQTQLKKAPAAPISRISHSPPPTSIMQGSH